MPNYFEKMELILYSLNILHYGNDFCNNSRSISVNERHLDHSVLKRTLTSNFRLACKRRGALFSIESLTFTT